MIYAIFDTNGRPAGFWDNSLFDRSLIPSSAVEITAEDHAKLVAEPDAWRWVGGMLVLYAPPTPTIEERRAALLPLTARQLRLGLIANGIMPSQVQAALEAMPAGPDREKALVEWEYASAFSRVHPLIASVGAALDLTDEQIDEMWMAAASL